jgi:5-formyltetrahydrofolate cyclo-ligase
MNGLSVDQQNEKKLIRQAVGLALRTMSDKEYQRLNKKIYQKFFELEFVRQAGMIMVYYSIGREVETVSLIEKLLRQGKRVGLPVCRDDLGLDVREIHSLSQVQLRNIGKISLFEPLPGLPLVRPEDLELMVIPGLAFDRTGNRLGHGAGYYDRFLHQLPSSIFKLGLSYEFQVIPKVPVSRDDMGIDGLLTDRHYNDCHL